MGLKERDTDGETGEYRGTERERERHRERERDLEKERRT